MKKVTILICAIIALTLCSHARADYMFASSPSGTEGYADYPGTLGTIFTANQTLTVTQMGIYDLGNNGLVEAHDVGLWEEDGTLLASVTIQSGTGSALLNGYRWEDLSTSVTLNSGQTYVLGAYYNLNGNGDHIKTSATINSAFTVGANAAVETMGDSLAMPIYNYNTVTLDSYSSYKGFFGPNLVAVPVPATILLGFLGLGVGGWKLRKSL